MAGELQARYTTGSTVYCVILDATGQAIVVAGPTPEPFNASHWSTYARHATEQGTSGIFYATMPVVAAGTYSIVWYTGSDTITDTFVGWGTIEWSGTATVPLSSRGTSTLTQTQVTGGAYALNNASFAFNSAMDFTSTQKAATIATVTNLTNAPTSGDLTSTMKTSVQASADAAVTANASINSIGTIVTAISSYLTANLGALGANLSAIPKTGFKLASDGLSSVSHFTGMTSLAQWLGLMSGKQTGNSTALAEIRAMGAGSGTYDPTTDSPEALRDHGDSAWITGGAGAVVITPVSSTVSVGEVVSSDFTAYQNSDSSPMWSIGDSTSTPVNLTGKSLSFTAWLPGTDDDPTVVFTLTSGDGDISVSGTYSNQVTVEITTTETAEANTLRYALRNTTDDQLLAIGGLEIVEAPVSP